MDILDILLDILLKPPQPLMGLFLTMVKDIKACIVNLRITPELDDFTSIASHKGKAVVDYFITRQGDLPTMKQMEVKSSIKMIDARGLQSLLSDQCHLPNHSMLTLTIEMSGTVSENLYGNTLGSKELWKIKIIRKPEDSYMDSETALRMIPTMLCNLKDQLILEEDLNSCYDKLVNFIIEEAERSVPTNRRRRTNTKFKDYWDDSLTKKWKHMKECEKMYRMYKKKGELTPGRCNSLNDFRRAQREFDKTLKHKKREFCHGRMLYIESACVKSPTDFWSYIKKLGPSKRNDIPWEIEVDGHISTDKNTVLKQWKLAFENLYQFESDDFNDEFKRSSVERSEILQSQPNAKCDTLNDPIMFEEVERAVNLCKNIKGSRSR